MGSLNSNASMLHFSVEQPTNANDSSCHDSGMSGWFEGENAVSVSFSQITDLTHARMFTFAEYKVYR